MTVLILTKEKTEDYETTKLIKSFSDKNIPVRVCYFSKFDVIINLDRNKDRYKTCVNMLNKLGGIFNNFVSFFIT